MRKGPVFPGGGLCDSYVSAHYLHMEASGGTSFHVSSIKRHVYMHHSFFALESVMVALFALEPMTVLQSRHRRVAVYHIVMLLLARAAGHRNGTC